MTNDGGVRRDPLVVGLLAAVVVLLAVQLIFQGLVMWRVQREAQALQPRLEQSLAKLDAMVASEAPREVARGADAVARDTLAKVKEFTARRAALDGTRRGPLEKIDHMTALMQLLADELVALLNHFAMTQGVLVQPGLDGDGDGDGAKQPAPARK